MQGGRLAGGAGLVGLQKIAAAEIVRDSDGHAPLCRKAAAPSAGLDQGGSGREQGHSDAVDGGGAAPPLV
jgi:hypothetical protein